MLDYSAFITHTCKLHSQFNYMKLLLYYITILLYQLLYALL